MLYKYDKVDSGDFNKKEIKKIERLMLIGLI